MRGCSVVTSSTVDDLPAAIADLEAKGAEFLMKPRDGKGRIAFVKGPDSVSIELVQTQP